ncbi:hypothetical protein ACIBF1_15595 [Spirillospora sp. NPDC050679]
MTKPIAPAAVTTAPTNTFSDPDDGQTTTQDLAALRRADRRNALTRAAITVGFLLIGAALTAPVLPHLPLYLVFHLFLMALAGLGVAWLYDRAAIWLHARYRVQRISTWRAFRWRVTRRWYAPGSWVYYRDDCQDTGGQVRPLVVLAWAHDPACRTPWVLTYDGIPPGVHLADNPTGQGAVWNPLDHLRPATSAPDSAA